jgi:hypothetical protein
VARASSSPWNDRQLAISQARAWLIAPGVTPRARAAEPVVWPSASKPGDPSLPRRQAAQPRLEVEPEARRVGRRIAQARRRQVAPARAGDVALVQADEPEAARGAGAGVVDVRGAAGTAATEPAAPRRGPRGIGGDAARPDLKRVETAADQPGPGVPGGAERIGDRLVPTMRGQAAEPGAEHGVDPRQLAEE